MLFASFNFFCSDYNWHFLLSFFLHYGLQYNMYIFLDSRCHMYSAVGCGLIMLMWGNNARFYLGTIHKNATLFRPFVTPPPCHICVCWLPLKSITPWAASRPVMLQFCALFYRFFRTCTNFSAHFAENSKFFFVRLWRYLCMAPCEQLFSIDCLFYYRKLNLKFCQIFQALDIKLWRYVSQYVDYADSGSKPFTALSPCWTACT